MDIETPAVVIENGSRHIRAGVAGSQEPTVIHPNVIAYPRNKLPGQTTGETFCGHEAFERHLTHTRKYPVEYGIVTNWDAMEEVWHHTFHNELRIEPEEHAMLHTEAPLNPKANREKLTQIMFEKFNVPALYLAAHPVLALLAAGRTTGCVFESGGGMSHVVPVYEGHLMPHTVQKYMISGDDVTYRLAQLLHDKGIELVTTADRDVLHQVKEKMCYVSTDVTQDEQSNKGLSDLDTGYTMPSGQAITIGNERFQATEIIFDPALARIEHWGAHETIYNGIRRCDKDLREEMFRNVCLSGGNTMFPGLRERLQSELRTLAPEHEIEVISAGDPTLAAWQGGSLLASKPDFMASAAISKDEYDEDGPRMAHIKCFQ